MVWTTDLVLMLRVLINDLNVPQKNTDAYLQQVLITAGIIADSEITFPFTYAYDIGAITIIPDPVVKNDALFEALVPLKAACVMTQADFRLALGQGIKVRDGDSAIDTSVSFRGYKDILQFGPCAVYTQLKDDIQSGRTDGKRGDLIGAAVMGPHRLPNSQSNVSTVSLFFDDFASTLNSLSSRSRR